MRGTCLPALGFAVASLLLPATAQACNCVAYPGNCANLGAAAGVFEATVEAIEEIAPPRGDGTIWSVGPLLVRLTAVQAIRGQAVDAVVTARGSDMCGYDFKVGERYLIVAEGSANGRVTVTRCGLTRPLGQAGGLIEYARALDGPRTRTFVWGEVRMPVRWADFEHEFGPVPGVRLAIDRTDASADRLTLAADADGRFRVHDLPHGEYVLSLVWPEGREYLKAADPVEFRLASNLLHACQELGITAVIDSAISGVVVDANDRPVAGAFVQLGLGEQTDLSRGIAGMGALTDEHGRYRFEGLPPGRYLIGLDVHTRPENRAGPPTEHAPEVVTLPLGAHAEAPVIRKRGG